MERFKRIKVSFFIIVFIWTILFILNKYFEDYFENHMGDGFMTSYLASLLEDIIFFGLIGYVAIILSTKLPEDENISIRIRSLANNKIVGEKARSYLANAIVKRLFYSSSHEVMLEIREIAEEEKCLRLFSNYNSILVNMCKDIKFPILGIDFSIEPNEKIRGSFGYISYLGIVDSSNGQKQIFIEKDIHEFKTKDVFKKNFNFEIAENSTAQWGMNFSTWGKFSADKLNKENWYFAGVVSFTESFNISVKNSTNKDLKCAIRYPNREIVNDVNYVENDGIELKRERDGNILAQNLVFFPNDKFEIYFYE